MYVTCNAVLFTVGVSNTMLFSPKQSPKSMSLKHVTFKMPEKGCFSTGSYPVLCVQNNH